MGITDKGKLMNQLEVLQAKEAHLQKKELLLMGGESSVVGRVSSWWSCWKLQ